MAQNPFGDIPLFRELQRLLASGSGPINLEIAKQVAVAQAAQAGADLTVRAETEHLLADAVRASEQLLAGYSRLPLDEPSRSKVTTRQGWIDQTLTEWRWLLDHLAQRFIGEMGALGGDANSEQMNQVMSQVGPLLLGVQTGSMIGSLSTEAMTTNDPPIPRDLDGELFVVAANLERFATDYELDAGDVTRWLALDDVAHSLIRRGVSWVDRYHRSLLTQLVDSIEIDISELEQRMIQLQSQGLEALQEQTVDRSIPLAENEQHHVALDRVRAFVSLVEGYAAHIADSVKPQIVAEPERIDESVARHKASPSAGKALLAQVLGFSSDRELESAGRTFCEAVVKLEGLPALNRVWDAPDNLPAYGEIRDPFVWIERVLHAS